MFHILQEIFCCFCLNRFISKNYGRDWRRGNVTHNFATLLRSLHMIVVAGDFKCKTGKELCGLWTMCSCIATVDLAEIVESLKSLMDF